jgi:predicted ATPase
MAEEQSFGEWLREKREGAGLTQQGLADYLAEQGYWPSRPGSEAKSTARISNPYETLRHIELSVERQSHRPASPRAARALARWQDIPAKALPDFISRARRDLAPRTGTAGIPGLDKLRPRAGSGAGQMGGKLFGREADIDALTLLLDAPQYSLVTLVGPPGVGKTQLAIRVGALAASRFDDGVQFVDLAPLGSAGLVLPTLARALGVDEVGGQPIMQALKSYLRNKRMLLIMDNFEHVMGAVKDLLELLNACAALKLLVTSRQSLSVAGEREYMVATLPTPDPRRLPPLEEVLQFPAIQLFAERAAAKKSTFNVSEENARSIADICFHFDGLPLAIELVASRLRYLTPQELAEEGGKWLDRAEEEAPTGESRHHNLRSAIKWSYDLLSESERAIFQYMSIFSGGSSLATAQSVIEGLGTLRSRFPRLLRSLIDRSLVKHQSAGGRSRYVLLETLREYGLEQLEAGGDLLRVGNAHMRYYFEESIRVQPKYGSAEREAVLQYIDLEHDNFRAALRWAIDHGEQELACLMSGSLAPYWYFRNYFTEAHAWLKEALQRADERSITPGRALALFGLGLVLRPQSRFEEARAALDASVALWSELLKGATDQLDIDQCTWYLAFAQLIRGLVALNQYDKEAHSFELTSLKLFELTQDPYGQAMSNVYLGSYELQENGDADAARPYFTRALDLYRTMNDDWGLACAYEGLGRISLEGGDLEGADELLKKALDYSRRSGERTLVMWVLSSLGFASIKQGNVEASIEYLQEGIGISIQSSDEAMLTGFLELYIVLADLREDWQRAAVLYGARENISSRLDPRIRPLNRSAFAGAVERASTALGGEAWERHRARGLIMTNEEAASYARPAPDPGPDPSLTSTS